MKKIVIAIVVLAVVAVTLGSTGVAFAKSSTPAAGYGTGWNSGRGVGGMMGAGGVGTGLLHDYMITAYSEALKIPVTDLEARLADGETMAQIALATGLTVDELQTLMIEVRSSAIDNALADGVITQAQADWMKLHGAGQGGLGRGMRGSGQGQYANPNCPYYNQP